MAFSVRSFAPAAPAVARQAARRACCAPVASAARAAGAVRVAGTPSLAATRRQQAVVARAAERESGFDTEEVIKTLQEKWEQTENKSALALYAAGSAAALWASATVVGVVNSIPLLPKVMELIGLGYSSWFVYRYLLFKESRKELVADVEELKARISGTK